MNKEARLEHETLSWVKKELDAVLDHARRALEAYIDNQEDISLLTQAQESLRQVGGTLQMVELYGAAMLAQEMEEVTHALINKNVRSPDDAFEVLLRAILQLPDYLEHIQAGNRDIPVVLLPLLNDLRTARDASLLSEKVLFFPDAPHAVADGSHGQTSTPNQDLRAVAKRLRHHYQLGLLSWFRGQDARGGLEKMKSVALRLRDASRDAECTRLWWSAAALVEAVSVGALEPNVTVKSLLGKMDREIKRLSDHGEEQFAAAIPEELSKNILYYAAYADDRSALIREVKQVYGLQELLPHGRSLREARDRLAGPNAAVMRTVSEALREDLSMVKDNLESFVSGADRNTARLEPVAHKLRTIADTLSMLSLSQPAEKVKEQAGMLEGVVGGRTEATEGALTHLAGVILDAEIAVNNLALSSEASLSAYQPTQSTAPPTESAIAAAEHRRLLAAVIAEALRDLERAKETITGFVVGTPPDQAVLAELPAALERIRGAMAMAHVEYAPALLSAVSAYVSGRLLTGDAAPNEEDFNSLADAITSIEYILEAASKGRRAPQAAAEIGRASVARLGYPSDALAAEEPYGSADGASALTLANPSTWTQINSAFAALVTGRAGTVSVAAATRASHDGDVAEHEAAPPAAQPHAPAVTMQTRQSGFDAPSEAVLSVPAELVPLTGTADDEILQVFIEEAEEALDTINLLLPKWLAASDDHEAFTTVRRSFHTLKGSGRLVGAQLLGEFAWAFENLLNRVIDGTVAPSEPLADALNQAPPALAELIAQIKGQGAPAVDVLALMATAHAMSKPNYAPASEAKPAASSDDPESAAAEYELQAAHGQGDHADDVTRVRHADDKFVLVDESPHVPPATATDEASERAHSDEAAHAFTDPSVSPAPFDIEDFSLPESLELDDIPDVEPWDTAEQESRPPVADQNAPRDPVLLDIFTNEARQHLRVLEARLAPMHGDRELPVTGDLLRALHTLAGSARTAQIPQIARLCAPLEQFAAARAAAVQPIPINGVRLLGETVEAVHEILEDLSDPLRPLPPYDHLLDSIESILRDELARQTAALHTTSAAHVVNAPAGDTNAEDVVGLIDQPLGEAIQADAQWQAPVADAIEKHASHFEPPQTNEIFGGSGKSQARPAAQASDIAASQDRELVEIFLEEARDLMNAADNSVQQWRDDPDNTGAISDLQRYLHTLKGGARMADCAPIGDLSHALESMISSLVDAHVSLSPPMFDAMHRAFDRLHDMLEQTERAQAITPAPELIALIDRLRCGEEPAQAPAAPEPEDLQHATADIGIEPSKPSPLDAEADETAGESVVEAQPTEIVRVAPAVNKAGAAAEQVRVNSDLLDNLVNSAGEVNIYHARLEQQITGFKFNLKELEQTVARLRDQLRKMEIETEAQILFRYEQEKGALDEAFDPLELDRYSSMQQLSRALGESVNDLVSIKEILLDQVRGSETLLLQQSRVSTDLQESLMRARMVQFSGLAPRLRRIARQTANELGKKVKLHISGESNELDRSVLDRMVAPLEHMLRNAVSHGIEFPDQRRAQAKPEEGVIRMSIAREGSEVVIKVEDDGAGIDLRAVRRKACSLGMIRESDKLSSHDIMQFILEPGFSTAAEVTQISGRGVGMDVVSSEIKQLSGVLSIDSTHGKGTTFTVRLPFTLAINQALLVQSSEDIYAIPLTSIEGIVRLPAGELRDKYEQPRPTYEYAANIYELRHLGALLGRARPSLAESHMMYPIMLVKAGERRVALQVEGLLGNREVVVKPVGPQISKVKGISGATILGDGRVVLILDLAGLVRAGMGVHLSYSADAPASGPTREKLRSVMVVDDSITIRKVTSRMLERHSFSVLTAKDGVDAVSQLQDNVPDLLLLDIEMPRMDGYELATYIRNTVHLREIPIIMITSRTGEKHRQRAIDIGVNRYLGKPYQESELLDNIHELLAGRGVQ